MQYDLSRTNAEGRVFYASQPIPISHPDRLATVATLAGMKPAPVRQCRVLELACADGGNLIPMAQMLPESRFVGVDRSASEVATGCETIQALGLTNIRLEVADLAEIDESFGQFDYIICHGTFSWTPRNIQEKILSICRQNLAPRGVAYLNYNTYPGWYWQGMIRDFLRLHAMQYERPEERVAEARKALDFLVQFFGSQTKLYGQVLTVKLTGLKQRPDGFLYHAFLDVRNDPTHFCELQQRARREGLQYLGDAETGLRWSKRLPKKLEDAMAQLTTDPLGREQLVDFLTDRASRYSLLCHQNVPLRGELQPDCLAGLYLCANVQHDPPLPGTDRLVFRTPNNLTFATDDPGLQAALAMLGRRWPLNLPYEALRDDVSRRLPRGAHDGWPAGLLRCYETGMVQIHACPDSFTTTIHPRPRATPLARWQAQRAAEVTNLKHMLVPVSDLDRQVLQRLDGQCDQGRLAGIVADLLARKEVPPQDPSDSAELVRQSLSRLAASCLLLDA